jgi:ferredoxin-fold anticodon binding domain-containing protein
MERQHIENLFRRLKGEVVSVKSISGGVYEGRVVEVTNDYVCIHETGNAQAQVFLFYTAVESMLINEANE